MVSPPVLKHTSDLKLLLDPQFRWVLRQKGSGAQRFLMEVLSRYSTNAGSLNSSVTALSEREAAAAISMDLADVAPGARATATEYCLGFISFGWESFDFALPRGIWFRRLFQDLVMRLQSGRCRELAEELTGYEFMNCGDLVWGDD